MPPPPPPPPPGPVPPGPPPPGRGGTRGVAALAAAPTDGDRRTAAATITQADTALACEHTQFPTAKGPDDLESERHLLATVRRRAGEALPTLPPMLGAGSDADLASLAAGAASAAAAAAEAAKLYSKVAKIAWIEPATLGHAVDSKKAARGAERQARDAEDALKVELERRAELKKWAVPDALYGTPRSISLASARKTLGPEAASAVESTLAQPGALVRYFAEHPEVTVAIVDFFAYSCTVSNQI